MVDLPPPPLPGFEPSAQAEGAISVAARETLAALESDGVLTPRHRLTAELIRQLARAVDRGLTAPKVTVATATLSKHLLEAIEQLPQPDAGGTAWDQFTQLLADAERG